MKSYRNANDPLVPIDWARLEAAAEKLGLTVAGLAKKAGLKQQTVDAMQRPAKRGKRRRCRRSHRDRLAGALGLGTEEGSRWLGKEVANLAPRVGFVGGEILEFNVVEEPSASDLGRYHLLQRCIRAWARDAERKDASGARDRKATGKTPSASSAPLQHAINQLADAVWWRGQLLRPEVPEAVKRHPPKRPMSIVQPVTPDNTTRDSIECALLMALEAILEPWLQGHAQLREDNLLALSSRYWWQGAPGAQSV